MGKLVNTRNTQISSSFLEMSTFLNNFYEGQVYTVVGDHLVIELTWVGLWILMQSLDGNLLFWVQSVIDNIVLHATTKIIILVGIHSPSKNNGAAILLFLRVLR